MGGRIKETKQNRRSLNWQLINRILLALIIFFGASYLVGVNELSIKTVVLQEQKKKIFGMKNISADLELQAMSLGSFTNVGERLAGLGLVKVDKVDYVAGVPAVAMRR